MNSFNLFVVVIGIEPINPKGTKFNALLRQPVAQHYHARETLRVPLHNSYAIMLTNDSSCILSIINRDRSVKRTRTFIFPLWTGVILPATGFCVKQNGHFISHYLPVY